MRELKLIAFDSDDLAVMSAHLQDAVLRVADMAYLPKARRFALVVNRFDWEKALSNDAKAEGAQAFERCRSGVRFERVLTAQLKGINLKDRRQPLSLLAISFEPSKTEEDAGGAVTLTFAGHAAIRLTVECLEAEMRDLGAVWATKYQPEHNESNS